MPRTRPRDSPAPWFVLDLAMVIGLVIDTLGVASAVRARADARDVVPGVAASVSSLQTEWDRERRGDTFAEAYTADLGVDSLMALITIRESDPIARWCAIERRLTGSRAQLDAHWEDHGIVGAAAGTGGAPRVDPVVGRRRRVHQTERGDEVATGAR